ncbi:MAG: DHHW family protein [Saccharofermentans sp.]|nr:DHHW family protein [Saccharofermentans sp.]
MKKQTQEYNVRAPKKRIKHDSVAAMIGTFMLFILCAFAIIGGDREYSENENRFLALRPKFSLSTVEEGKFMKDTDSYFSDQFLFRDAFVGLRTKIDVFFGKRDINGVYVGEDHFLFEKPSVYDEERVTKTTDMMNKIRLKNPGINSYVAIAPNSNEILSDYLPKNAPVPDQTEQINRIYSNLNGFTCIDLCTPLKSTASPEMLYYRTDHHWTSAAVDIAYEQIATHMQLEMDAHHYEYLAVTNDFQGTLASSSGIFSTKDTIYIPAFQNDVKYKVTYVQENKTVMSVFDRTKLAEKNKYEVFFGGNFSQINIETNSANDRTLLVIKDSYANSLIPLLIPHYRNIIIVDPRYYNGNIQQTIEEEGVTDILWMYNANTFLNDTSISEKFS